MCDQYTFTINIRSTLAIMIQQTANIFLMVNFMKKIINLQKTMYSMLQNDNQLV